MNKSTFSISIILILVASQALTDPIQWALQFHGQCTTSSTSGVCNLKSSSQTLTTKVNTVDGASLTVSELIGNNAIIYCEYIITGENTYSASGNITFGTHLHINHALTFESLEDGLWYDAPEGYTQLTITYNVTSGFGGFAGATGLITVNELQDGTGATKNIQVGTIFVENN